MSLTTSTPRTASFVSLTATGFHRVAYYEWGDPACDDVVICVHGLARNGRDFDVLGERLAPRHRVLAVDMPGRGQSEWLRNPNDYAFPAYLTVLTALIARADVPTVDFVGTSMGGLLGMVLAAQPNTPIRRLVVNDIGPVIEKTAIERIAGYVGQDPLFESFDALAAHIREVSAPFGPLTDEQWTHLARSNSRQRADGRWGLGYDPAIAIPFRTQPAPPDLWPVWDAIRCPTLVTHGGRSDLLSMATAQAMTTRGPHAQLVTFPETGHAPAFMADDQVRVVEDFLSSPPNQAPK